MMSNQKAPVPFSLYGSETNRPEVVLWQAVLLNQVRDLFLVRVWKMLPKGRSYISRKTVWMLSVGWAAIQARISNWSAILLALTQRPFTNE